MEFYGVGFHKIPYICTMIIRTIENRLTYLSGVFKVVAVTGNIC